MIDAAELIIAERVISAMTLKAVQRNAGIIAASVEARDRYLDRFDKLEPPPMSGRLPRPPLGRLSLMQSVAEWRVRNVITLGIMSIARRDQVDLTPEESDVVVNTYVRVPCRPL